jgi:hypothetical protein
MDHGMVKAKLPENLEVTVRFAKVNPFANRAKRRMHTAGMRCCR